MSTALENLIVTYHELNSSTVDELTSEPSPLEFMRYVARNRPFVVRGGAADWTATRRWNAGYLLNVMGSSNVNVAITPAGFVTTAATEISWTESSPGTRTQWPSTH
jgi:peptidyl-lysine (3S)-dioxygenase / protease